MNESDPWHFDHTSINYGGVTALLLCSLMIILLSRKNLLLPLLLISCFISNAQRINIFGLDFTILRILLLLGFLRVIALREYIGLVINRYDIVLLCFFIVKGFVYSLQQGNVGAIINQCGVLYDGAGAYFLCRVFFRDVSDIQRMIKMIVYLSIPVMFFMLVEWSSGRNLFAFFGGVPEFSMVREGRIRCQGAFSHPIIAGCFWAVTLPLAASMLCYKSNFRLTASIGTICILIIIMLTASSTPMLAVFAAILGMCLYFVRKYMGYILGFVTFTLICLHIAMRAPVWHLLGRVSVVGGSTGYHRFHLFDQFLRRTGEWFLLGTPSTSHWGWGLFDVTNQFVLEGVRGGAAGLALFLSLIIMYMMGLYRKGVSSALLQDRLISWALWTTFFTQCCLFFAVSYFGQIYLLWYMLLAASTATICLKNSEDAAADRANDDSEKLSKKGKGQVWGESSLSHEERNVWGRSRNSQ